jgi:antitoxin (DNA-binding transcriptional repressor) of toxin-antitoxin stability system
MHIGTRELKNRLSHYLRQARESKEPIYVTDRGGASPVSKRKVDGEILLALAAAGRGLAGQRRRFRSFKPIKRKRAVSLSSIVLENRR